MLSLGTFEGLGITAEFDTKTVPIRAYFFPLGNR